MKAAATILVRDSVSKAGIHNVHVTLSSPGGPQQTDITGFCHYAGLDPKAYEATITLTGIDQRYALPTDTADKLRKTIDAGSCEFFVFELDPLTSLEVTVARSDIDGSGVVEAEVECTPDGGGVLEAKTTAAVDGKVVFTRLRKSKVNLKLTLKGATRERFHVNEGFSEQTRTAAETATREVTLNLATEQNKTKFLVTPLIYLKLQYKDPDNTTRLFPKDFEAKVFFFPGNLTKDVKVLDDAGRLQFEAEKDQTHFTLKFDSAKLRLLVHTESATVVEVLEDKSDVDMQDLTTAKKQFFAVPKTWSMVHSSWAVTNMGDVSQEGKVAIPATGVGTVSTPGELTLLPKLQYVRWQFHDRKYGREAHGEKPVHIPAVVVKAARKCDANTSAPLNPIAGSHDAVSNWMLDKTDNAKGRQAIVWIVTKDDSGVDLPSLDKSLLIEFGWDKGFVQSTAATARKIETLPVDDARRKPGKDRSQFYDLPKAWKNRNYYTRLTATTGKFFDELTDAEVIESYDTSKPLTFSLDDIVLVKNDGSQIVKDRDAAHLEIDRSQYSRFAILYHDAADSYDFKVWKPRASSGDERAYHTDKLFAKEAAADVYRNYLPDYPAEARVVVFCNGFHDVWDKRTESATCADKAVCGARAAKLDDTDISGKTAFNATSHVTAGYVHRSRRFDQYYLHGGATDGTTVYGAIVSHFCVRAFSLDAEKPTVALDPSDPVIWNLTKKPVTNIAGDAQNFRTKGVSDAMQRWNEKKYQLEQSDEATEVVIKTFALFEAKDIDDGTLHRCGGKQHSDLGVCLDTGRSSANEVQIYMRKSAYREEGSAYGSMPSGSPVADYGSAGKHRNALAHELGHAVIGLWDDYITEKQYGVPSFQKQQRFPGVHLNRDAASMMSVNQSVRLRSYWGRTRWINTESRTGNSLHGLLADKQFVATYVPPGKEKLRYSLPVGVTSFWKPAHTQASVGLGHQGKTALHLYPLGEDEFSCGLPDGPYDSMVVVDTRIAVHYLRGMTPAPEDWTSGAAYVVGNVADHEADYYVCVEDHTASADFATDSAHWVQIDPEADYGWSAGSDYAPGEVLEEGGQSYVAVKAHKAGSVIDEFWIAKGADQGAWAANGADYYFGEVVQEGGDDYLCLGDHLSGPAWDTGNWLAIGVDTGAYADGNTYAEGELCQDGGVDYVCVFDHEAGSVTADVDAKRIVECDCEVDKWDTVDPADKTTYVEHQQWLGEINKAITRGMEGPNTKGKFRLTRDGATYSKIYVRAFPQYFDATTGAVASGGSPHFTVKVKKSDSKGFSASGSDITMSKNANTNTFMRYIYGRVSDDSAIRKTQTPTAAIQIADLTKIKEWVDGKIGGTTTAEAVAETPVVTAVSPTEGAAVGDTVTLTGERFTGATKVTFGGIAQSTVTVVSATQITCAVPAGAASGRIKVFMPKGSGTSPASCKILPKITAVAPTTPVAVGTEVTLTGTSLAGVTGVKINAKVATFTAVSATEVKAKVPVGASSGTVELTTRNGSCTSTASVTIST